MTNQIPKAAELALVDEVWNDRIAGGQNWDESLTSAERTDLFGAA